MNACGRIFEGPRYEWGYNTFGQVTKQVNPDGSERDWHYDALGRVDFAKLDHMPSDPDTQVATVTTGFDLAGRSTAVRDARNKE